MSTMNISLPEPLRQFVEAQVAARNSGTTSEYVRELIRRDQDRVNLRNLLLTGAESDPAPPADDVWFDELRNRVHQQPDA